ncbi:synapse-associated protein 1-like protein [Dinothrombium tinctorium]|uniref:Synapse-associated protein 1-like protein n=1 Tax=Dinothrombium tinctorium TaxID=1965070 RepID=A0A443R7C0_9ACAR|nr:synapse-associated protein 1-like protein [Dinothrombium tinctorium]
MNFVNNILKKTPFKSEASEEREEDDSKVEQEKKDENSGGVGVGFVSNILKSTFKSEGGDSANKEASPEAEEGEKQAENASASGGFMSSVWKTTSLFRSDTTEGNKERKESLSGEQQNVDKKEDSGASGFISNVLTKSTSIFKSETSEKRKGSESSELEKAAEGIEEEELCDATSEPVSQKAIDSAKSFGNFLYSVANKAGQTVTATAKHLKHTVEHNSFLMDFTKEQQEFIKEHGGNIQAGEPPWVGCDDEEEVKKQILSLSQDKRNFVRSPPSGVQFDFDMQQILPVAVALLKEDENLGKMRFEIVPKLVNEETFWRNYFYRVSLIKQSTSLSNMDKACKGWASSSSSSGEGPDEPSPTGGEPEFISDSIHGNVTDEDLQKGMRQLGVEKKQSSSRDDKQWEDEITKELQEFEVVNSDVNTALDAELEKDLANL